MSPGPPRGKEAAGAVGTVRAASDVVARKGIDTVNHRSFFGVLSLAALIVLPAAGQQGAPSSIVCELSPGDGGEMVGGCRASGSDSGAMKLVEGGDGGTSIWVGTLTIQRFEVDVDIKRIEYADGSVLALRTPFGWFPTTLRRDGDRLVVSFEESELPPSEVDVRIVQAARQLLVDEAAWDRQDDRVCAPTDTTFADIQATLAEAERRIR